MQPAAHHPFRSAKARAEWQSGDPALIFNAGLCHRQSGDSKQAMDAFDEYKRKAPQGPPRRSLEERISDVRRQRRSGN